MKTTAALVKLIIFMIVTSLMTFVLAATIGSFSLGGTTGYQAAFSDVTGLLPGNEVRIAGVKVGNVKSVELADDAKTAKVGFTLEQGRTIPQSAVLRLRYRNIVGERYLAITEGPGSSEPLKEGALVPLAQTRNALDLTVLFNGFKPLFQALDPGATNQVAFELIQTLQGEGGTVESLMQRTASLTTTLADRDAVIGRVINNLGTVLETVDQRDTQLNELVTQLQRLSSGFAQDRVAIGSSLAGINDLTSATASLLEDTRGPLRADIASLNTLAGNLNEGKGTLHGVLKRLPGKLDKIVATATYGSWFNFYLCGVDLDVTLPKVAGSTLVPAGPIPVQLVNTAARCQGNGVKVGG
ncbi:MAG: transporter substrate-binding protein [Frankiales bacterium]|nr:transporter substrate-binding protein [Frankiales bacterium]